MGRKGCRKAREDLKEGGQQTVLPLLRKAFAGQWEAQTGHTPWFNWQRVGSNNAPVMTCPRCGIVGNANDFWDQHSQEFCTRAIELGSIPVTPLLALTPTDSLSLITHSAHSAHSPRSAHSLLAHSLTLLKHSHTAHPHTHSRSTLAALSQHSRSTLAAHEQHELPKNKLNIPI